MKKLLSLIFLISLAGTTLFAQPEKDLKNAQKALNKFFLDSSGDASVLNDALSLLDSAFESDEVKAKCSSWLTRGQIFNEVANNEFKNKTLNPDYQIKVGNAAMEAFTAFHEASKLAEKKSESKDALSGLSETENHLNNFAIFGYQSQDFAGAFSNFKATLDAREIVSNLGGTSRLDIDEEGQAKGELYGDQLFFTAVSGYYGGQNAEAKPLLQKLFDMGTSEAVVYEALYKIHTEEGATDAVKYLEAGREKFPDDTGILFAEINHYLTSGQLETLIKKLEVAIEKEPDNISVYTTMGSVYDQLQAQTREAGDMAKADEYFGKAQEYYSQALAKDPSNFDAKYSTGALYYNKAATYVDKLNELAADLTPQGMKNYDAAKAEMDGLFKEAMPHFLAAENLNPKDMNTVIALKEIYARLNQMDKSNEYKEKYEALAAGQE